MLVYLKGPLIRNAKSWLVLGPLSFQPVELAKIRTSSFFMQIISAAAIVSIGRWKYLAGSFIFFLIPAALVALQPNLGSAVVLFGIWYGTLLVSGLPLRRVLASLFILLAGGILLWSFGFKDATSASASRPSCPRATTHWA